MKILHKIENQGFTVTLMGDCLEIKPAQKLTQPQRDFLRHHKAKIITELKDRIAISKWLDSIEASQQDRLEVFQQVAINESDLQYFLWRSLGRDYEALLQNQNPRGNHHDNSGKAESSWSISRP